MLRVLRLSLVVAALSLHSASLQSGSLQSRSLQSRSLQSGSPQSGVAQSPAQPLASQSDPQPSSSAQPASPAAEVPPASLTSANPIGEAHVFYRKGDFDHALAKYQEFLKVQPHSPDAYAGMVRVYLKEKRLDDAVQTVENGLKQTDSPRLHVAQAEVWFRQGRITEAETEWVKVINSGYPEARAYLGLARVRDAIGNYASAKKVIDKAHELDPEDPDILDEWIDTLSRAERIKYLETSLAGDNAWDTDQRADIASYLQYLKDRDKQHANPCRLVSKVTSTETPLVRLLIDPEHMRGYGLSVSLNGRKNDLMLDTGASGLLVRRGVAERAGISKITATKVSGIGKKGRRNAYVGIADSIKVGNLEFQNCPVEVMEDRSVGGEDGLIGADVFENFLVEIDFPNEKLKLSELPKRPGETEQTLTLKSENNDDADNDAEAPSDMANASADAKSTKPAPRAAGPFDRYIAPEMQSYTRIFRFGHDLLVPTSIGKVPQKLFLLDTGALTNFISPEAAREVTKVHGDSDTIVEGISGRVDKVYSASKAVLAFGHLRQENQDLTAFDTKPLSDDVGTEVSGFLGFVLLRFLDIKIDYRDDLVDFQFDAKRWHF
jgi:tetratricopeptide (TPR) repeat protein